MKKAKIIAIILTTAMALTMFSAMTASAYDIIDIKVPVGEARINGIVDPGEWDAATGIVLGFDTMTEKGYPAQNRPAQDLYSTSVKLKIKDGYLYFLEERRNPSIRFTHDNPMFSYESNGGIVFFFIDGDQHDLFYMPGTLSNPNAPAFCYRPNNSNDDRTVFAGVEGVTVVTPGVGSVCEAKIKLSDIGLTMADFESGDLKMYHCSTQVFSDSYNDKYAASVGVENDATLGFWEWAIAEEDQQPGFLQTDTPTWGDSGDFVTVADTFDLSALLAAEAAAASANQPVAADNGTPAAEVSANPPSVSPQTADPMMIFVILLAVSVSSVFVLRRKSANR